MFASDIGLGYPAAARRITSPTMADAIRVLVSGAAGRMGETVCEAVEGAEDMELAGRADPALGSSVSDLFDRADAMVDFSTPEAAPANVMEAVNAGVHAVVGSTGFDLGELREAVTGADGGANCFVAPNFAIGAVLMMEASKLIAPQMPEAEIIELHHDEKKDAPSGTAKRTAELIGEAGGNVHEPIHSVRLPGLVAHHEVVFGGQGQTLSVRHDSTDRTSFMPGVLLAIRKVPILPDRFVVGLENLL
jgi:4-hydroxy-tetrahydrodipicolinate reductase